MVVIGIDNETPLIKTNPVYIRLKQLGCNELADMYDIYLRDEIRSEYWANYFNSY